MRRLVALVVVAAIVAVGCGADEPTADALGSLDGFDNVIVGERGCDEAGDECARVFRFRSTTLGEIVDLVNDAGYPVDPVDPDEPQAALRACKPAAPDECALITEDGSTIRVAVSSPAG